MKYIYPPRVEYAVPRDEIDVFKRSGYIAQYKLNDTRLVIIIESPHDIQLWNRHGQKVSYNPPPELQSQLVDLAIKLNSPCVLDGGLLDAKHRAVKDTIAIWDVLAIGEVSMIGTSYRARQELLHTALLGTADTIYSTHNDNKRIIGACHVGYNFAKPVIVDDVQLSGGIFLSANYTQDHWGMMWENVDETNKPYVETLRKTYSNSVSQVETKVTPLIEGLVFKNMNGVLKPSFGVKNNMHWLGKSRVETGRHLF